MKLTMIALGAMVAGVFCLPALPVGAAAGGVEPSMPRETPAETAPPGYVSVPGLTGRISAGAAEAFRDFFDPSPVRVRPFVHVSAMTNASSMLGVMLADHLAAMLNGHANASSASEGEGQRLEGVLQEVDGYLRIHVLGTNGTGEHRSHVALVEMSTPLYRALHTYAETW